MTAITLKDVVKVFRANNGTSIRAVDGISIRIADGEVLAILGPSGCGKSTLLRLISGLEPLDSGTVSYDNERIDDVPMTERGIGMVFQQGALMPHWDAEHNIGFFFRLRQRDDEVPERIRRISQITGIGLQQLMSRRPRQLSGGERQRVAIARALARDLNILLFDEPFSSLDAKLRSQARIELKRLLREFPVTAVYVTHDQDEAITLADRIAIMNEGCIVQVDDYHGLYHTPVNLFIAQFFGTPPMNFFNGTIHNGKWQGENFSGYAIRQDLPNDTPVTMGIRPQYLTLQDDGVAGVVESVVPYLSERFNLVEVSSGTEGWTLALPLEASTPVGQTIHCGLSHEHIHFFDTKTGLRIG